LGGEGGGSAIEVGFITTGLRKSKLKRKVVEKRGGFEGKKNSRNWGLKCFYVMQLTEKGGSIRKRTSGKNNS